jgi:hypothetical protein
MYASGSHMHLFFLFVRLFSQLCYGNNAKFIPLYSVRHDLTCNLNSNIFVYSVNTAHNIIISVGIVRHCVVCCQVEVSATSWSLVQRSPTDCGVSKTCDREASTKRGGPGTYRAVEP